MIQLGQFQPKILDIKKIFLMFYIKNFNLCTSIRVFMVGIEQVMEFGRLYREAVREYKTQYFRERSAFGLFTRYMIAIINNCDRYRHHFDMKNTWPAKIHF